jgi:hypothetical protein
VRAVTEESLSAGARCYRGVFISYEGKERNKKRRDLIAVLEGWEQICMLQSSH